ncbi:hypothetical protein [Bifidobacterium oedipodis]|nr:hypothetical protein [Bifidobacterium sp. DSM 109957]
MGLFESLKRTAKSLLTNAQQEDVENEAPSSAPGPELRLNISVNLPDCVQLSGTTTSCKDSVLRLAQRHGIDHDGFLEIAGKIQREPDNPYDDKAIALYIEGERIGYLPSMYRNYVVLPEGTVRSVPVQLFTAMLPKGLRGEAWIWIGDGRSEWEWSRERRPRVFPEKRLLHDTERIRV